MPRVADLMAFRALQNYIDLQCTKDGWQSLARSDRRGLDKLELELYKSENVQAVQPTNYDNSNPFAKLTCLKIYAAAIARLQGGANLIHFEKGFHSEKNYLYTPSTSQKRQTLMQIL